MQPGRVEYVHGPEQPLLDLGPIHLSKRPRGRRGELVRELGVGATDDLGPAQDELLLVTRQRGQGPRRRRSAGREHYIQVHIQVHIQELFQGAFVQGGGRSPLGGAVVDPTGRLTDGLHAAVAGGNPQLQGHRRPAREAVAEQTGQGVRPPSLAALGLSGREPHPAAVPGRQARKCRQQRVEIAADVPRPPATPRGPIPWAHQDQIKGVSCAHDLVDKAVHIVMDRLGSPGQADPRPPGSLGVGGHAGRLGPQHPCNGTGPAGPCEQVQDPDGPWQTAGTEAPAHPLPAGKLPGLPAQPAVALEPDTQRRAVDAQAPLPRQPATPGHPAPGGSGGDVTPVRLPPGPGAGAAGLRVRPVHEQGAEALQPAAFAEIQQLILVERIGDQLLEHRTHPCVCLLRPRPPRSSFCPRSRYSDTVTGVPCWLPGPRVTAGERAVATASLPRSPSLVPG